MSIIVSTSNTSLSVTQNTTVIENIRADTSIISTNAINNIQTVKIAVTTIGVKGSSGTLTQNIINRLDNIIQNPATFIDFTYTNGSFTNKSIYDDNIKTTKLFNIDFTYLDGNLDTKTITEVDGGANVVYSYNYVDGGLVSIDIQ